MISRSFLSSSVTAFSVDIIAGRIMATFICFPCIVYCVVNVHNCPQWSYTFRRVAFKLIQDLLPPSMNAASFILGDLNISNDSLRSGNDQNVTPLQSSTHKAIEKLWTSTVQGITERHQGRYTFMRGLFLSRLDYVFSKLPSEILFDLQLVCRTKW